MSQEIGQRRRRSPEPGHLPLRPRRRVPGPRAYADRLHVPMVIVLSSLVVTLGAIGYALRPGTDAPPPVPNAGVRISLDDGSATRVSVDQTLYWKDPQTVVLELDIFGVLGVRDTVSWRLLTDRAGSQPYACGNPYRYVGRAHPSPFAIRDGQSLLAGAPAGEQALSGFVGRPTTQVAANALGLEGVSPGHAVPGTLWPIAKVTLCWDAAAPLAFSGEYVSATLPAVRVQAARGAQPRFELTRHLYFADPVRQDNPVTAQYSLQAGALPTTTDPFGWHWAAGGGGDAVQLTGISLPESQHESYLGFVSGVLLGIAGGALVSLVQEATKPLRRRPE